MYVTNLIWNIYWSLKTVYYHEFCDALVMHLETRTKLNEKVSNEVSNAGEIKAKLTIECQLKW